MSSKRKRTLQLLLISFLIMVSVGFFLNYQFNRGPVNVSRVDGTDIAAAALYDLFVKDSTAANTSYIDKVLDVSGIVSGTGTDGGKSVLIKTGVDGANINCALADSAAVLPETGSKITIRGICMGIQSDPDLGILGDVILTRCVITDKK